MNTYFNEDRLSHPSEFWRALPNESYTLFVLRRKSDHSFVTVGHGLTRYFAYLEDAIFEKCVLNTENPTEGYSVETLSVPSDCLGWNVYNSLVMQLIEVDSE